MLCNNSEVSRKRNKKLSFSSFRGQQFWQQLIIMILNLLTYLSFYWLYIEAVIRGVLLKKVFLEISQNSQENSCARVSFLIKLQASISNFFQKQTLVQLFSFELCGISPFLQYTTATVFVQDVFKVLSKHLLWCIFVKIVNDFQPLRYFYIKSPS